MHRSGEGAAREQRVHSIKLSTDQVAPSEQFDLWRHITSDIVETQPIDKPEAGFRGSLEIVDLGPLQLTRFEFGSSLFCRNRNHVNKSGFDHWTIMALTGGRLKLATDDTDNAGAAGSVLLNSLAAPLVGRSEDVALINLYFPRDEHWQISDQLERASRRPIDGPMSLILREFVISLGTHAKTLTIADIHSVNDAFTALLKAMVNQTDDRLEAARQPITAVQFDVARRFIGENLHSPDLGPDMLCTHLGVSRRQLYYLFERHDGVANYIKNRRLAACYAALTRGDTRKMISSIAFDHGFTSLSSFYRLFHKRYGFNPGEARSAWHEGRSSHDGTVTSFGEWMSQVRAA